MTWLWDFATMDSSYETCHSGCLPDLYQPADLRAPERFYLAVLDVAAVRAHLSKTGVAVLGTADVGRKSFSQLSATRVAITKAHKPSKH